MAVNVLLLGIEGTQALPLAKSLYKRGDIIWGTYHEKNSYGYYTKYIHNKIAGPSPADEEAYAEFLVKFLGKNQIDVIIPLGDQSAKVLSRHKEVLSPFARFIIPDYNVFMQGYDKNSLMKLCRDNGFPHPETVDLGSEPEKVNAKLFPALIKPNIMTGGRGMVLVKSVEEFNSQYPITRDNYGECHLQQFIEPGGRQIKVQVFMQDGRSLYSSVIHKQRFYPENGGSSCCNTTIEDGELSGMCEKILRKLGWTGFADFDLIEDPKDGEIKVMEINPRVPACVRSAIESGIDYGAIITDASLAKEIKSYSYEPGVVLRHMGFEMLWFFKSKNRWKTKPSWFKFFGKRLYFQDLDWSDPKPFIFGTWGNVKKQLNPEFRKAKSGLR